MPPVSEILFMTSAAPAKSPFSTKEKRPPLGVGFMISILREHGHHVHFIDRYLDPDKIDPFSYVRDYNIDFVGIYSNTICFKDTLFLINGLHRMRMSGDWSGKILVGGPHASVVPDTIPDVVDVVVVGEGDKTILDIVEGVDLGDVVHSDRLTQTQLNKLPFQPWDIFTRSPYDFTCPWMDATPTFTLNTSRGCPFNCSFCSVNSIFGFKYTRFGADRIVSEIKHLVEKYGAKGIYFREDNFTVDIKRIKRFCGLLQKKNINITWACETRVDNLDRDIIKMMSDAGCKAFYLGVESGSQKILDIVNKKIDIEQVENVINWGKKFGIRSYCSLITGVPGETFKDYKMTMNLMKRLKPYSYSFNVFVGIPYSDLYRKCLDENLYEYIDDVGLMYLPGFDVKTRYFYGMESTEFVDYDFDVERRSEYDRDLLRNIPKMKLSGVIKHILRRK